jgi:hypothetical protein
MKIGKRWQRQASNKYPNMDWTDGNGATEAVAKLWLALNDANSVNHDE